MKLSTTAVNRILSAPAGVDLGGGGGAVANIEGGGSGMDVDNESDNEEDVENQTPNQKKRGFDIFSCISFSPISTDTAASAYRATAQTVGRLSNSAQSRLRSTLNSAQSRLRPKNKEVRTKAEFVALLEEYEYNLFKILHGHKIGDSLLEELENWSEREDILKALELDGSADLHRIATELNEYFIKAETKALAFEYIKILILLHFPPSGQNMQRVGNMYTGGTNRIPINATMEELFYLATLVIADQFGVSEPVARIIAMNSCVVADVVPITLPHDAAGKATGTPEYKNYEKARDRSEEASVRHIKSAVRVSGATHAIILGSYPWKFYKKHPSIFDSVTVLQKFPLIHPSALRIDERNSIRQAFELSFSLNTLFAKLSGSGDNTRVINYVVLNDSQCTLSRYINWRRRGNGEYFYGAWYNGALVLLEHGAVELNSLIKQKVSSLPSSCANLKRRWGRSTNSEFPNQEDLVAALSGETNQDKTVSYYHFDIGVFNWKDCLKDELPEGSLRDYGLPSHGRRNTYKNITMGVQNDAVLGIWGDYVEANAKVQGTRNSQLTARISAPVPAAADEEDDEEDVVDGW